MANATKIPLEPIESSNLASMGYDLEHQILAVRFKSGDVYHYAPVPVDVVQVVYGAESKGRAYGERIKGKYPGQRMTGPCSKCGASGWIGERCTACGCADYTAKPEPIRHAVAFDDPSAKSPRPRTECKTFVPKREIATTLAYVTCKDCLEILGREASF